MNPKILWHKWNEAINALPKWKQIALVVLAVVILTLLLIL